MIGGIAAGIVVFNAEKERLENNISRLKKQVKDVYIFDNHNHAFYFWIKSLKKGNFTKGCKLVHVDQHKDTREPENYNVDIDNIDDVFRVSNLLFSNADIDKMEVTYPHLFQHLWTMREELIPYLPTIEKCLLEFDFENDKFYLVKEAVDKMEYILKTFNEPNFAKDVNALIVKYCIPYRPNNPFKDLYFHLLFHYPCNVPLNNNLLSSTSSYFPFKISSTS